MECKRSHRQATRTQARIKEETDIVMITETKKENKGTQEREDYM
jgi:hypothetical protein